MSEAARLQNVFYRVENMERARAFYERVLEPELRFADGDRWVQYRSGTCGFALAAPSEAHHSMAGAAIVFEVHDLEVLREAIAAAGGAVLGERDMGNHGVTLIVADPDGNVLHLWKRA
ncbi:MAG: VOC family protein [Rhizobiaceae bacterium]|nr:VOC family protein [Rhizobiaceae bacterium]